MGAMQQRKGRNGELEIVNILNAHGIPAKAGQAVSYGATPDVIGVKGIHCEVKRNEKLNVLEAMKQAIRDAEKFKNGLPTLFHRRNRSPWLVTMTLEDWLKLYERWVRS